MEEPTETSHSDIPELPDRLPAALPIEPPSPASGCGQPVWMSCGCLLLLVLGLSSLFLLKADDFVDWWLRQAEQLVVEGLPDDVDSNSRARLGIAFEDLRSALARGDGDAGGVARMQRELGSAVRKAGSGELARDDVLRLIDALERAAGAELPAVKTPANSSGGTVDA